MRLIDNDEDEVYDVVFITKYSDGIVERVYGEECRVYFKDGYRLDGDKYIDLDPAEQYTYITLTDADGAAAAFEDIQPGMVLSVARSKNGEVRCAVLGAGTVEGAIEQRDDDFVWIDGTAYAYNVAANDLQPGKTVTAKLNFKKQVSYGGICRV